MRRKKEYQGLKAALCNHYIQISKAEKEKHQLQIYMPVGILKNPNGVYVCGGDGGGRGGSGNWD